MKISLYLSILFLALFVEIVTANVRLQRSAQQYCGSRLADIMKIICKGKYYDNGKRSQMDLEIWDYKDLDYYNSNDYPYRSKQEAMSFIPPRILRSSQPKIIDECCHKPCFVSELKSYCAN